jgi:hypothetical protein
VIAFAQNALCFWHYRVRLTATAHTSARLRHRSLSCPVSCAYGAASSLSTSPCLGTLWVFTPKNLQIPVGGLVSRW